MIISVFQKNRVLGYSWSTLLWHRCNYLYRSRDALSPVCGILKFLFINFFFIFFLIMARYRLNSTNYVLKLPKKPQKVPTFNQITLSTLTLLSWTTVLLSTYSATIQYIFWGKIIFQQIDHCKVCAKFHVWRSRNQRKSRILWISRRRGTTCLLIFRLTTSRIQKFIPKANLKWECPYFYINFFCWKVLVNIKKNLKINFLLYFKIVILKWPKVFKEMDHRCFRVFGPYFIGKSPCTT